MKGDGWYSFPPPKPGDRAARGVHFLSVLYIVGLGDGGGSQPQRRDGGARTRPGGQVAGHGEGLCRKRDESDLSAPLVEEAPLSPVDAAGVVGEYGFQRVGHALVGGTELGEGCGLVGNDLKV